MDTLRRRFSLSMMCRVLQVSRSGFYAWRRRPPSKRCRQEGRLQAEIRAAHERTRQPPLINSGHRIPETHANTKGAAVHSKHLSDLVADFTVTGIPSPVLAKLALKFSPGGVGVYPTFVHVDTRSDGAVESGKGTYSPVLIASAAPET